MMDALKLAKQHKKERLQKKDEEKHLKQASQLANEKKRKELTIILDSALSEFDGVNGIKFSITPRGRMLEQYHSEILIAYIGLYTYDNPNVDYKDEITELAINWEANRETGHNSSETKFIENIARVLSEYI